MATIRWGDDFACFNIVFLTAQKDKDSHFLTGVMGAVYRFLTSTVFCTAITVIPGNYSVTG